MRFIRCPDNLWRDRFGRHTRSAAVTLRNYLKTMESQMHEAYKCNQDAANLRTCDSSPMYRTAANAMYRQADACRSPVCVTVPTCLKESSRWAFCRSGPKIQGELIQHSRKVTFLGAAITVAWTFMSESQPEECLEGGKLLQYSGLGFGAVFWFCDGHECPSCTSKRPG